MESMSASMRKAENKGNARTGRSDEEAGRPAEGARNPAAAAARAPEPFRPAPAVRLAGFGFSYPDGQPVLADASWCVEAGSFALLVGDTGSGKTTLLRSLKPEIAPEGSRSGALELFGEPYEAWRERGSAACAGYVAQSPENQIVCDTVWHELAFGLENLGEPPDAMRRRVAEVAHFFGIEPWVRASTAALSGGQKQMVNLAAVLAMQPRLLLLDEPTAQLDPVAEKSFLHALFRINRELGITVVVATHAPEAMAAYATAAFELSDGRVEAVPLERFSYAPCHPEHSTVQWTVELPSTRSERREASRSDDAQRGVEGSRAALAVAPSVGTARDPSTPRLRCSAQDDKGNSRPSRGRSARADDAPPVLEARDVRFRYTRDGGWVLRGADVAVAPGTVHAVVGGNGCGKSTLLRVLAGALKHERGRVRNAARDRQALLPQDPKALFVCDSVEEELREWQTRCGYDDAAVQRAAHRFGLDGLLERHPYDLSGGQQQKLALAKVLLTNPQLLLLDEPTKGLDARSKLEAADALAACAREGRTVVLVTHDLAFVSRVADRVSMLFDGETACTEPTCEFFERNLFYRPQPDGFLALWDERAREDARELSAAEQAAGAGDGAEDGGAGERQAPCSPGSSAKDAR